MIFDKMLIPEYAKVLGHLKPLILPFVPNGKLMVLGVPIFKCIRVGK